MMAHMNVSAVVMAAFFVAGCAPSQPPVVAAPCEPAKAPEPPPEAPSDLLDAHPVLAHARAIVAALNDGRCGELAQRFDDKMKEALPERELTAFCSGVRDARGEIRAFAIRRLTPNEGRFVLTAAEGAWRLSVNVDDEGNISGFRFMQPLPEPPPVQAAGPFVLPFVGEWLVSWGGDNPRDNHHLTSLVQRRAADLVMVGDDGKHHTGAGTKNEDYFAYGKPVLAVAAGTVVTVVDGVPDNTPREMNEYIAVGNMVVIQHGASQFSVYAHLKPRSLRVREGQKVRPGQPLGEVGNSGRSSEPHLHFHVQSGARLSDALGVEAFFEGVETMRDGAWQARSDYRFLRGDHIRPAAR